MTIARCFAAIGLLAFAVPAHGQDQATTLLAALQGADVVVRAQVTAATDPSPDWHRLHFVTTAVVKGEAPATFVLMEPAGACCGRSLFALQVGDVRLLFLRRQGPLWHPFGGARGVLPADATVLVHVQALQAATAPAALAQLLVDSLDHEEARIADDAAHALATLPQLSLSTSDRERVAGSLRRALAMRTTRSAALVDVAIRVADPTMLDTLLACYVDTAHEDQANLLRAGLRRCSPAAVTERMPLFRDGEQRGVRTARLLMELPGAEARAALSAALRQTNNPRVQLGVIEGLLADGVQRQELAPHVPATVLELALRRQQQPRRFRAIEPSRR